MEIVQCRRDDNQSTMHNTCGKFVSKTLRCDLKCAEFIQGKVDGVSFLCELRSAEMDGKVG